MKTWKQQIGSYMRDLERRPLMKQDGIDYLPRLKCIDIDRTADKLDRIAGRVIGALNREDYDEALRWYEKLYETERDLDIGVIPYCEHMATIILADLGDRGYEPGDINAAFDVLAEEVRFQRRQRVR